MIARILWLATLLGTGLATAALQLDRQADLTPQIAPLVPGPARGYAQAQLAAAAVAGKDPATALAAAETLVRRRPMPAEHLTLLAAAQARSGQAEAAAFSIQMAARRGWRDPLAQEAMLRLALAAGDKPEAARRYAALFSNRATPDAALSDLALQVLGEPGGTGQQTFATIIAGAPRWHAMVLRRGVQVLPPATFSEVLQLALERGAQLPCEPLMQTVASLRRREPAAADGLAGTVARRCF